MSELPELLRRAFAENLVATSDGGTTALHSNVSREECELLYATVRSLRPSVSFEIGFAQGISTLAILQALRDNGHGHHHVIDPFQSKFANCGLAMVRGAGLQAHFSFYEQFPESVLPSLPRAQFGFIDSSHLFDFTICEFVLADRRLDVGGCLGFHDSWMPSQQAALRYILGNRAYSAANPNPVQPDHSLRRSLARIIGDLPGARRIFNPGFLTPWSSFALPNLVILRKNVEDSRHWTHHVPF